MPKVQPEAWQFATAGLAILWCFASVKWHLTPGALNSLWLTDLYNVSQNIMTMARICHFDDLPHSTYFVTTYLSLVITMLHLKISKYNPLFITLHRVMCSAEAVWYITTVAIIIPWLHIFVKDFWEFWTFCYFSLLHKCHNRMMYERKSIFLSKYCPFSKSIALKILFL